MPFPRDLDLIRSAALCRDLQRGRDRALAAALARLRSSGQPRDG